jgi:hypothetical protein
MKAICRLIAMEEGKGEPLYEVDLMKPMAPIEAEILSAKSTAHREAKQNIKIFIETYLVDEDGTCISDSPLIPISTGTWEYDDKYDKAGDPVFPSTTKLVWRDKVEE